MKLKIGHITTVTVVEAIDQQLIRYKPLQGAFFSLLVVERPFSVHLRKTFQVLNQVKLPTCSSNFSI